MNEGKLEPPTDEEDHPAEPSQRESEAHKLHDLEKKAGVRPMSSAQEEWDVTDQANVPVSAAN